SGNLKLFRSAPADMPGSRLQSEQRVNQVAFIKFRRYVYSYIPELADNLLLCLGFLLRSDFMIRTDEPGFELRNILMKSIEMNGAGTLDRKQFEQFVDPFRG